jgi:quercetin dioxygenase-like cupin family protein
MCRHPREDFQILNVYHPANIPGKSVVVILIDMIPNAATPPHTHGGAAAIAIVVDGVVLNQMNCDEPIVSQKGDTWYEAPGCHHVRSENVGGSEKAKFLAVLIVDDEVIKDGFQSIVVLDAEKETGVETS